MALTAWTDYNARTRPAPVYDTVELDAVIVLEGEAAEESILRHYGNSLPSRPCAVGAETYVWEGA